MKRRMGTAILLVALLLTLAGCGKKKPGNDTSPTEGSTGVTGGVTEAITPTVAETVVTINAPRTEEPTPTGPVPTESLAILTEETVAGEWFASLRGITYRLALSADGKYEAGFPELSGEKTTGTWGLIGEQIVLDDNADALLVREEGLFWEGPGVAFAREKPVAADAGKPDKTVTAADFAGFWSSVYVRTESGLAPAADLGEDTDVYVEGNTVVLGGSIFGDTMCTFAYADGAMTWSAGEGAEAVSVRLELTDRGLMLLTMKTGGSEELSLYLTSRDIDWLLGE